MRANVKVARRELGRFLVENPGINRNNVVIVKVERELEELLVNIAEDESIFSDIQAIGNSQTSTVEEDDVEKHKKEPTEEDTVQEDITVDAVEDLMPIDTALENAVLMDAVLVDTAVEDIVVENAMLVNSLVEDTVAKDAVPVDADFWRR